MRKLFALAALFIAWQAHAQTYQNMYSPWMPWDPRIKYAGTMSLLDASGAEVNKTSLDNLFNKVTVVFPVQAVGATAVTAHVEIKAIGINDKSIIDLKTTLTIDYTLSPAYVAVAGSTPTFVYTPMTFSPTLVATAPMPVVAPPVPTPLPTPTPGLTVSAHGDCVGAAVNPGEGCVNLVPQLVDASKAVWTLVGTKVLRGGVDMNVPYAGVDFIYFWNGFVRAHSVNGYVCFGTAWKVGC
jgi:hypothetical protein